MRNAISVSDGSKRSANGGRGASIIVQAIQELASGIMTSTARMRS